MSPVLLAWIILKFSSLKSMFKDDGQNAPDK
jgi:hypothetical protein